LILFFLLFALPNKTRTKKRIKILYAAACSQPASQLLLLSVSRCSSSQLNILFKLLFKQLVCTQIICMMMKQAATSHATTATEKKQEAREIIDS
jgi:hypothetical protein